MVRPHAARDECNAITWTVANAVPVIDMALNESPLSEATGNVTTYLAHVLRFEHQ